MQPHTRTGDRTLVIPSSEGVRGRKHSCLSAWLGGTMNNEVIILATVDLVTQGCA